MIIRITIVLLSALLTIGANAGELLARPSLEQLQDASMPEGVRMATGLTDGEPWARITNSGALPVSVQLVEVPGGSRQATNISYEAELSSENITNQAYLELWAVVQGKAYFSRALHDPFTGTQPWRNTMTPFFLKSGEPLEAARLGVRFEGPGSVTIRGIELWDRGSATVGGLPRGMFGGVVGATVGILSGIWGCVSSYLVSRGRARSVVLGITASCAVAGGVSLLAGAAAWAQGATWELWYTFVLMGLIVGLVYGGMYHTLRARYQQSEERKMQAMDIH